MFNFAKSLGKNSVDFMGNHQKEFMTEKTAYPFTHTFSDISSFRRYFILHTKFSFKNFLELSYSYSYSYSYYNEHKNETPTKRNHLFTSMNNSVQEKNLLVASY